MKYYINSGNRRKRNTFLVILITITLIGLAATLALTGGFFYVNQEIGENQMNIESIKQNTLKLQEEINEAKKNLEQYEGRLNELSEEAVKFEPVIIPDSMINQ